MYKKEMEEIWSRIFSNVPSFLAKEESLGETTEETFEYQKNKVKTLFTFKFDKEGFPISTSYKSTYIPTDKEKDINQLKLDLKSAIEKEDFMEAAEIKKKINQLEGSI